MGSQYYDRGAPYAPPGPDMERRRPSPSLAPYGSRGPPTGRSPRIPDGRHPGRPPPPPQQYAMPGAFPRTDSDPLPSPYPPYAQSSSRSNSPGRSSPQRRPVDQDPLPSPLPPYARSSPRSDSPGRSPHRSPADYDHLPSPVLPYAQSSSRSNSPGGSPHVSSQLNYPPPNLDPPRSALRMPPPNRGPPQPHPHHGTGQWNGDGYSSSSSQSYFPPPQAPHTPDYGGYTSSPQTQDRAPLAPPPSARRGPASYYPQVLPVHPIAEETDSMRGSIRYFHKNGSSTNVAHSSYASSYSDPNAMNRDPDEPSLPRPVARMPSSLYESEPSRSPRMEEAIEEEPGTTLIREASVGKKSKPSLTMVRRASSKLLGESPTIFSEPAAQSETNVSKDVSPIEQDVPPTYPERSNQSDKVQRTDDIRLRNLSGDTPAARDATAGTAVGDEDAISSRNAFVKRTPSSDLLAFGDGLLPPPLETDKKRSRSRSRELLQEPSRPVSPITPSEQSRFEFDEPPSPQDSANPDNKPRGLSTVVGGRPQKPSLNLDIGAVRDAQARGSLTSLPDLIQRATQLAKNLERGKTASRLGLSDFLDGSKSERERYRTMLGRKSNSTLDILAAQNPGVDMSRWSSHMRHEILGSDSDPGEKGAVKKRRGCCGMPRWAFFLLLVVLVLLIAAAVIVPVMLLVVPKQHHDTNTTQTTHPTDALESCKSKLSCNNGGTNILSADGFCRCICVDGFTGVTCSTPAEADCTTISVGSISNATVGDDIPRLFSSAESSFGIPLDGEAVLGLFSSADMSCSTQNALVTFSNSGVSQRSLELPSAVHRRETPTTTTSSEPAERRDGTVFESRDAQTTSSTASASSSSSSPSTLSTPEEDFASVAVLYILQSSEQIGEAATAQENFQSYFAHGQTTDGQELTAADVPLGNGYSCDLSSLQLTLANGTVIGG